MTNVLTAARRSTRRYNNANQAERLVWRAHYQALLINGGMSVADASYEASIGETWDGMDTPRMAAAARLAA
jgi:hypothetical protein